MLCKEQGITVIGVCCVYEIFIAQQLTVEDLLKVAVGVIKEPNRVPQWLKHATIRASFLVFSTVLLLIARIKVMGAQLPVFTRFDNPAAASSFPQRHLTYNYMLPLNGWLLLCPSWLCCDWTMGTIPVIESLADCRNIATAAFYLISAILIIHSLKTTNSKRQRSLIVCLALIALPFIPASNLFFPVGFVVAERILYAPSMGFCMLVALGFETTRSEGWTFYSISALGLHGDHVTFAFHKDNSSKLRLEV